MLREKTVVFGNFQSAKCIFDSDDPGKQEVPPLLGGVGKEGGVGERIDRAVNVLLMGRASYSWRGICGCVLHQ